jgi:hypothetical protein
VDLILEARTRPEPNLSDEEFLVMCKQHAAAVGDGVLSEGAVRCKSLPRALSLAKEWGVDTMPAASLQVKPHWERAALIGVSALA